MKPAACDCNCDKLLSCEGSWGLTFLELMTTACIGRVTQEDHPLTETFIKNIKISRSNFSRSDLCIGISNQIRFVAV